jgi:small subunit ribosomal protein S2e
MRFIVCLFFVITAKATYRAIAKTYAYLTPDLWKETTLMKSPIQEHTDYLAKNHRAVVGPRVQ